MNSIILKQHYKTLKQTVIDEIIKLIGEHKFIEIEVEFKLPIIKNNYGFNCANDKGLCMSNIISVPFEHLEIDELIEVLERTEISLKEAKEFLGLTQ